MKGLAAMKISIRRGLAVALRGTPEQWIGQGNRIRTIGFDGADFPDIRSEILVAEGEAVAAGSPLFRDRRRPDILFTAPAAGTVDRIALGPRRRLASLEIRVAQGEAVRFRIPDAPDRNGVRQLLLASGLWTGFRLRPFGRIPDPGSTADAIFVTAIDTYPLAADPKVALGYRRAAFARGVELLRLLTDGPVFVCQGLGENLVNESPQIRCVQFAGPHPAGLPGTHIHRLLPVRAGRQVWQIHCQDVAAIGGLLKTGELSADRVISLTGPGVRHPRLVRVPAGSSLEDIVAGEAAGDGMRILSGPGIAGRSSRFLGRHHWQVTVLPDDRPRRREGLLSGLFAFRQIEPIIPTEALEQAFGLDLPVVPLLRALSVGDVETAARLGCLELLEEDLALVAFASGGGQDFPTLLRSTLDSLEGAT
jgi:Na+-transporting NADH:ubiquinone oxidoreductase subunit A